MPMEVFSEWRLGMCQKVALIDSDRNSGAWFELVLGALLSEPRFHHSNNKYNPDSLYKPHLR